MRTHLRGQATLTGIQIAADTSVLEILLESSEDWEMVRAPGFGPKDLQARFAELEQLCDRTRRPLPVKTEDSILTKITSADEYQLRPDYPLVAANCLVIMGQIPNNERGYTAAAPHVAVCVHHHLRAYALAFGSGQKGDSFSIFTRCDARRDLEAATESIATALTSRQALYVIVSSNDALGRERAAGRLVTRFDDVVMREPLHDPPVAIGKVVPLSTSWAITRRAFLSVAPRTLALVGLCLTVASAMFYILAGGHQGAYDFIDGVLGRVATAFFGAALIAGTERALDLRSRLRRSDGKARYAALIEWAQ
jgi:hypothetical protein